MARHFHFRVSLIFAIPRNELRNSTGQNPGLAAMWLEEQMRRDEPFRIELSLKDDLERDYQPLEIENDFLQVHLIF